MMKDIDSKIDYIDICWLMTGIMPGHAWLTLDDNGKANGWQYGGRCPKCSSKNVREKGSFDKCMDCGFRISFWELLED